MLDVIGWMFVLSYLGSVLVLVLRRSRQVGAFGTTTVALLLWFAAELVIGIAGSRLAVRPNLLMFAVTVIALTTAWVFVPALRRAAAETRIQSLIGLNAWRLGGILFLLLYAADRLPFPFSRRPHIRRSSQS
jgi:hypothetical protein